MKRLALVVALVSATTAAAAEPREQWIYRDLEGEAAAPTAVFLDWTYTDVIFRVQCDRNTDELVVEYFGDKVVKLAADDEMELLVGEASLPMRVQLVDDHLIGRRPAVDVISAFQPGSDLVIAAPNELGEPWFTGRAEPLRTVAADCTSIAP